MRGFGHSFLLVCLVVGLVQAQAQSPAERAAAILADARKALGGATLDAVKTVVANGRTKRVRGNNLQPIEFEMSIELPDKYLRKDEFPAEEADPTSTGFNGDVLLQPPASGMPTAPPAAARPGGPPPPTAAQIEAQQKARTTTAKQDFTRLALGLFAASPAYPVTFAFAAQAQAPQGMATVLDVKGEPNFALRLYINSETHLPVMVGWQLPPSNVIVTAPGQPPPTTVAPGAVVVAGPAAPAATASDDEKKAYQSQVAEIRKKALSTPVEHRIYFADYRDVEGVKLPFRLRRAIGTDTTEETTFDRFRLNTKIDPRKFAVSK